MAATTTTKSLKATKTGSAGKRAAAATAALGILVRGKLLRQWPRASPLLQSGPPFAPIWRR